MRLIEAKLPVGVGVHLVSDQPKQVSMRSAGSPRPWSRR